MVRLMRDDEPDHGALGLYRERASGVAIRLSFRPELIPPFKGQLLWPIDPKDLARTRPSEKISFHGDPGFQAVSDVCPTTIAL
jgi:hypothetical protein